MKNYFEEYAALGEKLSRDDAFLAAAEKAVALTVAAIKNGKKILAAGNGGSAAEAQHFAAEFVCKYKIDRKGYPAIAFTTDVSAITAWGNDASFDGVFERQMEALGVAGDIFFGFSTSGNSKNIINAFKKAKAMGITAISFSGRDGGAAKGLADIEFIVPSSNTPRIQEVHLLLLHSIAEEAEKQLSGT